MKSMKDMPSLKRGKSSIPPVETKQESEIEETQVNLINKLCASIKSVTAPLWRTVERWYTDVVMKGDQ